MSQKKFILTSIKCRGKGCNGARSEDSIYCPKCLTKKEYDDGYRYGCSFFNCTTECLPFKLFCHQHMNQTKETTDVVAKDIAELKTNVQKIETSIQNVETILKKDLASMADHLEILVSRLDTLEKNK